jgi:hypothetical protein
MSAVDHSGRVAVFHAAGRRADELRHSIDPPLQPRTHAEHVTALAASLGDLATCDGDIHLESGVVELIAGCLLWTDDLERERRAG